MRLSVAAICLGCARSSWSRPAATIEFAGPNTLRSAPPTGPVTPVTKMGITASDIEAISATPLRRLGTER
jgi:hypothetical protein